MTIQAPVIAINKIMLKINDNNGSRIPVEEEKEENSHNCNTVATLHAALFITGDFKSAFLIRLSNQLE